MQVFCILAAKVDTIEVWNLKYILGGKQKWMSMY